MTHKFAKPMNKARKVWMRSTSPILHSPCLTSPLDSESEDPSEIPRAVFKYKKVSQKVRPVSIQIPEDQQPKRQFPQDPLFNLPKLPHHPPDFTPTTKITACQEHGIFRTFSLLFFTTFHVVLPSPHSFLSVSLFKKRQYACY